MFDAEKLIIYEDKDVLVVKKPAGLEAQRGKGLAMDMESLLRGYISRKGGLSNPYIAVVHRLDRPVAGVMVYAKTKKAAAVLSEELRERQFSKVYETLVCADENMNMIPSTARLEDYIVADRKTGMSRIALAAEKDAKKAVLSYEVIEKSESKAWEVLSPFADALQDELSSERPTSDERLHAQGQENAHAKENETRDRVRLLRVRLETGRHHQIRVQLSNAGLFIAGDARYSKGKARIIGMQGIALCASELSFIHPVSGKRLTFFWNNANLNLH